MNRMTSFLDETLEAWLDVRQGVIDEVKNIPPQKFDFRPKPEVKSVLELVRHILEISMLMTGELTRSDTNFKRHPWPKMIKQYAEAAQRAQSKRELLVLLGAQMRDAEKRFRKAGDLAMWQFIERLDGEQGTKMQWLHHGIAQEMYHRGQLATYARLMGLEPALTKRISG